MRHSGEYKAYKAIWRVPAGRSALLSAMLILAIAQAALWVHIPAAGSGPVEEIEGEDIYFDGAVTHPGDRIFTDCSIVLNASATVTLEGNNTFVNSTLTLETASLLRILGRSTFINSSLVLNASSIILEGHGGLANCSMFLNSSSIILEGNGSLANCSATMSFGSELVLSGSTSVMENTSMTNGSADGGKLVLLASDLAGYNLSVEGVDLRLVNSTADFSGRMEGSSLELRDSDLVTGGSLDEIVLAGIRSELLLRGISARGLNVTLEDSTLEFTGDFSDSRAILRNSTLAGGLDTLPAPGLELEYWHRCMPRPSTDSLDGLTHPVAYELYRNGLQASSSTGPALEFLAARSNHSALELYNHTLVALHPGLRSARAALDHESPFFLDLALPASRPGLALSYHRTPYAGEGLNVTATVSAEAYWFNGTVTLNGDVRDLAVAPGATVRETFTLAAPDSTHLNVSASLGDWPSAVPMPSAVLTVPVIPAPILGIFVSPTTVLEGQEISVSIFSHPEDMEFQLDTGDGNVSDWTADREYVRAYGVQGTYGIRARGRIPDRMITDWTPVVNVTVRPPPVDIQGHIILSHDGGELNLSMGESGTLEVPTGTLVGLEAHPLPARATLDGDPVPVPTALNFPDPGVRVLVVNNASVITIRVLNRPPVLESAAVEVLDRGVRLTASASDPDSGRAEVLWTLEREDGHSLWLLGNDMELELPPGNYSFTAVARDGHGGLSGYITGNFIVPLPGLELSIDVMAPGALLALKNGTYNVTGSGNITLILRARGIWDNLSWSMDGVTLGWGNVLIYELAAERMDLNITANARGPAGNLTRHIHLQIREPAPGVEDETRTEKEKDSGIPLWAWMVAVLIIILILAGVLAATGRIPDGAMRLLGMGGKWSDVDPGDFNRVDLVILRKGERSLRKYEFLQAEGTVEGERMTVYALRIFDSPNGEDWDMVRESRGDVPEDLINESRTAIDRDIKKGFEVYVKGYGKILTASARKMVPRRDGS